MELLVEQQFSEELIHKAGIKFQADTSYYKKLGDFESYILRFCIKISPLFYV
jgi:hypothetical protein